MNLRKVLALGLMVASLAGCSTIDKITGQTDDTVLPGQREDAVPGKAQFPDPADAPHKAGQASTEPGTEPSAEPTAPAPDCPADDPSCAPQSDDTFSDPQ